MIALGLTLLAAGVGAVIHAFDMDGAPFTNSADVPLQRKDLILMIGAGLAIAGSVFTVMGIGYRSRETAARDAEGKYICPGCDGACEMADRTCPQCGRALSDVGVPQRR